MRRNGSQVRVSGNPLIGTAPHVDHFDPAKFRPDGSPNRPSRRGRPSRLRPDEAEQLAFLELIARTAERDLVDALVAKGYTTTARQSEILCALRRGWRPKK